MPNGEKWINVVVSEDLWLNLKQYSAELNTSISRLTARILGEALEQGDIIDNIYTTAGVNDIGIKRICPNCLKVLHEVIGRKLEEL